MGWQQATESMRRSKAQKKGGGERKGVARQSLVEEKSHAVSCLGLLRLRLLCCGAAASTLGPHGQQGCLGRGSRALRLALGRALGGGLACRSRSRGGSGLLELPDEARELPPLPFRHALLPHRGLQLRLHVLRREPGGPERLDGGRPEGVPDLLGRHGGEARLHERIHHRLLGLSSRRGLGRLLRLKCRALRCRAERGLAGQDEGAEQGELVARLRRADVAGEAPHQRMPPVVRCPRLVGAGRLDAFEHLQHGKPLLEERPDPALRDGEALELSAVTRLLQGLLQALLSQPRHVHHRGLSFQHGVGAAGEEVDHDLELPPNYGKL
mmetsp:Transcript_117791/g.345061  ORF Transcript_117791/g.345061 Transcript_117791/m.345061 type:complete len:325 (+) Transcript_117791:139-1113(+)